MKRKIITKEKQNDLKKSIHKSVLNSSKLEGYKKPNKEIIKEVDKISKEIGFE